MTPNLPSLDYSLIMSWMNAILTQFWPVVGVLLGATIGIIIFKIYRKAISD